MTSKHLEHDINCLASGRQAPHVIGSTCDSLGGRRSENSRPGGAWNVTALVQGRNQLASICRNSFLSDKAGQILLNCVEWESFKTKKTQNFLTIPNLKPVKNINLHINFLPYSLLLQ